MVDLMGEGEEEEEGTEEEVEDIMTLVVVRGIRVISQKVEEGTAGRMDRIKGEEYMAIKGPIGSGKTAARTKGAEAKEGEEEVEEGEDGIINEMIKWGQENFIIQGKEIQGMTRGGEIMEMITMREGTLAGVKIRARGTEMEESVEGGSGVGVMEGEDGENSTSRMILILINSLHLGSTGMTTEEMSQRDTSLEVEMCQNLTGTTPGGI